MQVQVQGAVDAYLLDEKGRHSGWFGGFVEDIPDCKVTAYHDDIIRPLEYTFDFGPRLHGSYRLVAKYRENERLGIAIEATAPSGVKSVASADTTLDEDQREYLWRVSWTCTQGKCRPALVPIPSGAR